MYPTEIMDGAIVSGNVYQLVIRYNFMQSNE